MARVLGACSPHIILCGSLNHLANRHMLAGRRRLTQHHQQLSFAASIFRAPSLGSIYRRQIQSAVCILPEEFARALGVGHLSTVVESWVLMKPPAVGHRVMTVLEIHTWREWGAKIVSAIRPFAEMRAGEEGTRLPAPAKLCAAIIRSRLESLETRPHA